MGRIREKRRVEERRTEERRSEKRKNQKKEDLDIRKGKKIGKYCIFSMMYGSGESKNRPAKVADTEPSGQIKIKNYISLWYEIHFQIKIVLYSDHFWKLRFRKNERYCGAKFICKYKILKYVLFGIFLEVIMSKKYTTL